MEKLYTSKRPRAMVGEAVALIWSHRHTDDTRAASWTCLGYCRPRIGERLKQTLRAVHSGAGGRAAGGRASAEGVGGEAGLASGSSGKTGSRGEAEPAKRSRNA